MDNELLELIDRYLAGELDGEELASFETQIRINSDLADDVEITRHVIEGIKIHAFRQMMKRIHDEEFGNDPMGTNNHFQ